MASVWHEQVERALKTLVETNIVIGGSPIKTLVRNPESEFVVATYPCATIYNSGIAFATDRFDDYWQKGTRDEINKTIEVLPPALPYDLDYRIELWAKYHTEINDMSRMWLGNVPRDGYLTVVEYTHEVGGIPVDVTRDCTMFLLNTINADIMTPTTRIFHRIYEYRVWVELDERQAQTKHLVAQVVINHEEM